MNTDKKNKIMAIFITVATFLVLGSIGFAFFSSTVSNDNNEKIQTSTATMSLKFDDNDNGISGTLNLGQSITKKFTLENTGTVDAYAKINWYNLVNTYTGDSLTYTLEQSTSENGTYTSIGTGNVPVSSTQNTFELKNGILVPVGGKYYYNLTITLNNLDINQNSDINASLNSLFNLEEGTNISNEVGNINLNFPDNSNSLNSSIRPRSVFTKSFSVTNSGEENEFVKLSLENLTNTYTANSLVYSLEEATNEAGPYTQIGSGNITSNVNEGTIILKDRLLSSAGSTKYYKFSITNQDESINNSDAFFYGYISINEINQTKESAVDKILNLVSGANASDIDIINAESVSSNCTNTLAYDGTVDNNLRYIGANPCNYVTFNGEEAGWRIIGVMNNVENGDGEKESRIKLVRATPLGFYSFDIKDTYGNNNWVNSTLKNELNGDYLDTSLTANKSWYIDATDEPTGVYDYTKGINLESQNMIEDIKWNLGGINNQDLRENATPSFIYNKERGTGTINNSPTSWIGKIALVYPSDYGFATSGTNPGSEIIQRIDCLEVPLYYWAQSGTKVCRSNSWIFLNNGINIWTLTPYISDYVYTVSIYRDGYVSYAMDKYNDTVVPALYLKSNTSIVSGNGSPENPFQLQ